MNSNGLLVVPVLPRCLVCACFPVWSHVCEDVLRLCTHRQVGPPTYLHTAGYHLMCFACVADSLGNQDSSDGGQANLCGSKPKSILTNAKVPVTLRSPSQHSITGGGPLSAILPAQSAYQAAHLPNLPTNDALACKLLSVLPLSPLPLRHCFITQGA